jgi:N-acetylmuramoyl-L-alanine amidase
MSLVTCGQPKDIDLAVPPLVEGKPSGVTIKDIAEGFSKYVTRDWARACNVEYRAGPSGPSVSLIAEGGRIYTQGDPRWPVMLATAQGLIIKDAPTQAELLAAQWAFGAGPWLIREGKATDLVAEIKAGGYDRWDPAAKKEQAAIGIRADGAAVHWASMNASIQDSVAALLARGCVNAIKLDSGGSTCVMDASGKILLGYSVRQVCCALVFRRLVEDLTIEAQTSHQAPPEPKNEDQMIVCIDPGHGGIDPGGVGPDVTLEKTITLYVAKRVKECLTRAGVKVIMTRETDRALISGPGGARKEEVMARAAVANVNRAHYCVSIHANTVTDPEVHGYEAFFWHGSVNGKRLAESISRAYGIATGMHRRRVDPAAYWILDYTHMPAALIELGFITNVGDRTRLKEISFLHEAALGIGFGILGMRAT